MRAVLFALVAVGSVAPPAPAADTAAELVVGVWEVAYSDSPEAIPVGTRLEFTADGKLTLTRKDKDDKERTTAVGTYKIDKEYLVVTERAGGKPDKARVCLLNKTALVLNDEAQDKVMVLKRVKAK